MYKVPNPRLRITPLGGLGGIGKNLTVYEYEDEMIIVDAGVMFPEDDMLGIDLVIPDITYIKENRDKLKAILITHGHEDHIGALPFIIPELPTVPLFASKLTQGLIAVKLKEYNVLEKAQLRVLRARDTVAIGKHFSLQCFATNHSIPGTFLFAITTPVGIIAHTGDFKFDLTPPDRNFTDFAGLAALGEQGVLLALSDSTNAERPGFSPSEGLVASTLNKIVEEATGRIIVATFASNVSRVQQIINASYRTRRKVTVIGRSLVKYTNIATELGYLKIPPNTLIKPERLQSLPEDKITIIATGSQGEAMAVLNRMAEGIHKQIEIRRGDTIIMSSSPIPGNEGSVSKIQNKLTMRGAKVIHNKTMDVHTSGHGYAEELKLMLNLLKPKFFMPVHGENRHLTAHVQLAMEMGIPDRNIVVAENGSAIEVDQTVCKIVGRVQAGDILIDGLGIGDIGSVVLNDRKAMANAGVFMVSLIIDSKTGSLKVQPEIISRGFIFQKTSDKLINDSKKMIKDFITKNVDMLIDIQQEKNFQKKFREQISEFLYEETGRKPVVLALVSRI